MKRIAIIALCAFGLLHYLAAADRVYFIPALRVGFQSISATNMSPTEQTVKLESWRVRDGLMAGYDQTIAPGAQFRDLLLNQWFRDPPQRIAYLKLTLPDGVESFHAFGSADLGLLSGTLPQKTASRTLVIPDAGRIHELYLLNPSKEWVQPTVVLREENGSPFIYHSPLLPAENGAVVKIEPNRLLSYITIDSPIPVYVSGMSDEPAPFHEAYALDAVILTANRVVPSFIAGAGTDTEISLLNLSGRPANFGFEVFPDNGTVPVKKLAVSLSAEHRVRVNAREFGFDPRTLTTGWVRIVADHENWIGEAVLTGKNGQQTRFALEPETRTGSFVVLGTTNGYSTGVSFVNPGTKPVRLTVSAVNGSGHALGNGIWIIPPSGRLVDEIQNLLPGASGQGSGYIRFTADGPLSAMSIIGYGDNTLVAVPPQ